MSNKILNVYIWKIESLLYKTLTISYVLFIAGPIYLLLTLKKYKIEIGMIGLEIRGEAKL
jgi:hypothetical protein